jgi:hypothetical protein
VLVTAALTWTMFAQANPGNDAHSGVIRGAGTSLVRGGTGSPSFTPVMTKCGFSWRAGTGAFECLALAPNAAAGKAGSGNFDKRLVAPPIRSSFPRRTPASPESSLRVVT